MQLFLIFKALFVDSDGLLQATLRGYSELYYSDANIEYSHGAAIKLRASRPGRLLYAGAALAAYTGKVCRAIDMDAGDEVGNTCREP